VSPVQRLLEEAKTLEALPHSAVRLSSLLSNADWVLKEIVQVVELDLVLTGKLLRLANSSTMAASQPVSSVGEAIVRIGPGPLLTLALASAVRVELQRPLQAYGLGERELWRHSVATALAVERSRKFCGVLPPPGSFVAGLLHDMGKLILERHLARPKLASPRVVDPGPAEEVRQLGVNHCVIGGLIAAHWKLPANVIGAITHHHDPSGLEDEPGRVTASFVVLADCVAHRISGGEHRPLPRYVVQILQIDRAGFDELCKVARESLEEILQIYS